MSKQNKGFKHPVNRGFLSLAYFLFFEGEDKRRLFWQGCFIASIDVILFPLLQYSVRDDKDERRDSGMYTTPLLENKILYYICKK